MLNNKITITIDTELVKVAPLDPTIAMCESILTEAEFQFGHGVTIDSTVHLHRAMLAAVPVDLPGVELHNGEPIGFIRNGMPVITCSLPKGTQLYTHADTAEVAALHQQITDLQMQIGVESALRYRIDYLEKGGNRLVEERDDLIAALRERVVNAECEAARLMLLQAQLAAQPKCKGCNGHGLVGNILDTVTCPFCNGTGEPPAQPAPSGIAIVNAALDAALETCPDYAFAARQRITEIDPQAILDKVNAIPDTANAEPGKEPK